eukprot:SAG31_NODE_27106_length_431_cov_0.936747_2_plen_34_part_01
MPSAKAIGATIVGRQLSELHRVEELVWANITCGL